MILQKWTFVLDFCRTFVHEFRDDEHIAVVVANRQQENNIGMSQRFHDFRFFEEFCFGHCAGFQGFDGDHTITTFAQPHFTLGDGGRSMIQIQIQM